jgi:ribonuclease BN (tRNA processing enzyme)
VVDGKAYLVDAGPGVVRRAQAAAARGIPALQARELEIVFLTHLHSDHTVGLPDLMLTPWVLERARPLQVYGPPGTRTMTDHLTAAYRDDIRVRVDGLEPANTTGHAVLTREISPGTVYRDERVTVTAFPVRHGDWEHALGYRFEARGRVIVISGDAAPSPTVAQHCDGCDILAHEVYSAAAFHRRPPEWQRYHAGAHTSTLELGEIARAARPTRLVLYHQLLWGETPEHLIAEVRSVWPGDVVYGRDLDVF